MHEIRVRQHISPYSYAFLVKDRQVNGLAYYSPLHCALLIRDSNLDRLFAIWQALHNDTISNPTFVTPNDSSNGIRVIAGGRKQNADTRLAPFNASEKIEDFWTSAAAKNTKTFGHVYPETRDWVYKNTEDIRS